MSACIVDSDVLIDVLRGYEGAKSTLERHSREQGIACSAITVAEVLAGVRAHDEERTRRLLESVEVVPVTRSVAERAALLKRSRRDVTLALHDCVIAATALEESAVLITRNARDYPFDKLRLVVPDYSRTKETDR